MIDVEMDPEHSIVHIHPESSFEAADFLKLANVVDPQIEETGGLAGVIIDAPRFPGWDGLGAMVTHFRFVRDHQRDVEKVAVVTDSHLGDAAQHLAAHFVSAQIKHFPAGQTEAARQWILQA